MNINGRHIHVADDTVTVDGDTHILGLGESVDLDGLIIARGADGAIRAQDCNPGRDVSQSLSGTVNGTIIQAGNVGTVHIP